MVDALVGLPQLLLDHALARIARTSRWAKSGQAFRNFAEEVQTARSDLEIFLDRGIARETLRKSNAEVSKGEK
ncbi:unnamed protein product [Lasius platythorax]|uniref:Uncharacterized protein n=1 Tax=Lasius platythorax TaxID=488582 RepID=A0AAV2NRC3_9HYME